jgi:glucose/arabinose dehydrogenase
MIARPSVVRSVLCALAALVPLCAAAVVTPPALPPRFTFTLLGTDIFQPTQVRVAPDPAGPAGSVRVFVATQPGEIRLYRPGQPGFTTVLSIPDVVSNMEYGLLAFELAPDFATSGHLYAFNTRRQGTQAFSRVSRFTVVNNVADPASEAVIWQHDAPAVALSHHGAALAFGPSNTLFISTGDQFFPDRAPSLVSQDGKILRVNLNGTVPANPFTGTPGAQPTIYAKGLRNGFRFAADPVTGRLFFGDVGASLHEEINLVEPGVDFGWPAMEGPLCFAPSCTDFTRPFFSYSHEDPAFAGSGPARANAIMLGPVYRGALFPAEYAGNIFFADFIQGWIKRLVVTPAGTVQSVQPFAPTDALGVVDMTVGPDGALYVLSFFQRAVYRVGYNAAGDPPHVVAAAPNARGRTPLTVNFSSAGTVDPDNFPAPLSYSWDFGNGATSSQPSPTYVYTTQGRFEAVLTVSDGINSVSSPPIEIVAGNAPMFTLVRPPFNLPYRAGDTIDFNALASDKEDGELPPNAFTWNILLMQGSSAQPFLGPIVGSGGSFTIPTTGRPPLNISYRVDVEARDSTGLPTRRSIPILPVVSNLNLNTSPPGIPLSLDGFPIQTPRLYPSVVNFQHTLEAPATFALNGRRWNFQSWSTGQPRVHPLTAPEGGAAATAIYTSPCVADFNGDGVRTPADVFGFITAFFERDPRADTDGNGDFTASDIFGYLSAYFSGC